MPRATPTSAVPYHPMAAGTPPFAGRSGRQHAPRRRPPLPGVEGYLWHSKVLPVRFVLAVRTPGGVDAPSRSLRCRIPNPGQWRGATDSGDRLRAAHPPHDSRPRPTPGRGRLVALRISSWVSMQTSSRALPTTIAHVCGAAAVAWTKAAGSFWSRISLPVLRRYIATHGVRPPVFQPWRMGGQQCEHHQHVALYVTGVVYVGERTTDEPDAYPPSTGGIKIHWNEVDTADG